MIERHALAGERGRPSADAQRLAQVRSELMAQLADNAHDADAWHRLAVILHQGGDIAAALEAAERAIQLQADRAHYAYLAGYISVDAGRYEAARRHFGVATQLRPEWAAAHVSHGEVLLHLGNATEAEAAFRAALALRPDDATVACALALSLQHGGKEAQARAVCEHALRKHPGHTELHYQLARLADMRGDEAETVAHLEACLTRDPRHERALMLRAALLRRRRDPLARVAFERAADRLSESAGVQLALADYLWECGENEAAGKQFQRGEALDPGSLRAALGARLLLPPIYRDGQDLTRCRQRFSDGLAELRAVDQRFRRPRPDGLADASWTNFFLAYQGRDDLTLQNDFGDLLSSVARARTPFLPEPSARGGRRIRVGFMSHFFFNCTAGRYFASWITDLDRDRFEVVVFYSNHVRSDDTDAIARSAHRFHAVHGKSLEQVARTVLDESLDVLVYPELGMHSETFALAALRLAPLQFAGWGHPTTSGLPTIDGYISCADMEGPEAQRHYRERLHLLPGLGTRYHRPRTDSRKTRAELGLPEGSTLYLCPQSLFKIHPDNDALFAQVLAADPRGRLVFFEGRTEALTRLFRGRVERALRAAGVSPESRLTFLGYMSHPDYLRVNALSDVMLDTVHWSGGNTSLDAIAMGLPLVTWPGPLMRSRQSAAMLRRGGLDDLVVIDAQSYVRAAVGLGTDSARRGHYRERLAEVADALFDDRRPVSALAELLERAREGGR